ncbi:dynamin-2A-like protein [Tanacetum coccineum]
MRYILKKSSKTNGWSKKWFVLNEKTAKLGYTNKQEERNFRGVINLEECNIEEIEEEEPPAKSSKDKKSKPVEKEPSLTFKITSKVAYKTVLKAHSAVVLKAESVAEKVEWLNKLRIVVAAKGGQVITKAEGLPLRHSQSEGSLDTMRENLQIQMKNIVGWPRSTGYVVELTQSTPRIEELLQEDGNVKRKRERVQKQSSLLSKPATRQLSIHDNRAAAASGISNGTHAESPRNGAQSSGDDWRSAFDSASNGLFKTSL